MSFGATLKAMRHAKGIGFRPLQDALQLGERTIPQLERGDRHPSRQMVLKLAEVLDCTPLERDSLLVSANYMSLDFRGWYEAMVKGEAA